MTLSKLYRWSVVFSAIIFLPFIVLFSTIENWDYKGEWLTRDAAIGMDIVIALLYDLLVCLLALTIFLN